MNTLIACSSLATYFDRSVRVGLYCRFWFYTSEVLEHEHQKWWGTGYFGYAPPESVADSLQSLMQNSAFNFAGIPQHLAWPWITSGMLISAASAWMVAFSKTSLNWQHGPLGFQSCKNTHYNDVQLGGLGHSLRGHLKFQVTLTLWCCTVADHTQSLC